MKTSIKYIVGIPCAFIVGIVIILSILWMIDASRAHMIIGDWGRKLGFYSYALEQYSRVIHLNPNNASALNSRAVTRYRLNQFEP